LFPNFINPFRGNSHEWQFSQEAGQIIPKRRPGDEEGTCSGCLNIFHVFSFPGQ